MKAEAARSASAQENASALAAISALLEHYLSFDGGDPSSRGARERSLELVMELERRYGLAVGQAPRQGFIPLLTPIVLNASPDLSEVPEPFRMMVIDARIRLDSVEPIHPDQRTRYVREGWRPMLSSEGREVHLRTGQVVMVRPAVLRR